VFAGVHGLHDALPLLPLALVLGALYHLRRSYVAIVTAHACFNAAFLVLALLQR
jgi:membrane protease YdiL (CAAX protease family)